MIDAKILEQPILKIIIEDIDTYSNEEYALARKQTFGGSDASVLCDVNLYKTLPELLKEKSNKFLTDEEKAIGNKPAVKKGRDLEPLILSKAQDALGIEVHKPKNMYGFVEYPSLSINFDGVSFIEDEKMIPIEAKLVTKYGEKYYNKLITEEEAKQIDMTGEGDSLAGHIKKKALKFGIPAYYYTQVQQEMMALDAEYGYVAVLFDDSWDFKMYYIKQDRYVQLMIARKAEENYASIQG